MGFTDQQKAELINLGIELGVDAFAALISGATEKAKQDARRQIDDAGERLRQRYPDPLGEDVGPV